MRITNVCFRLFPPFSLCPQVSGAIVDVSLTSWWLSGSFVPRLRSVLLVGFSLLLLADYRGLVLLFAPIAVVCSLSSFFFRHGVGDIVVRSWFPHRLLRSGISSCGLGGVVTLLCCCDGTSTLRASCRLQRSFGIWFGVKPLCRSTFPSNYLPKPDVKYCNGVTGPPPFVARQFGADTFHVDIDVVEPPSRRYFVPCSSPSCLICSSRDIRSVPVTQYVFRLRISSGS